MSSPKPPLKKAAKKLLQAQQVALTWDTPGLMAGVDEAGRGPLAGAVVAAAVILDELNPIKGLADSKKLTALKREKLYDEIRAKALCVGVGQASVEEIDSINILQATKVQAISAASIIAKVTRDRQCAELHARFPHYGFDAHKGYGTAQHMAALNEHGACAEHRRSYAPVREAIERAARA
jgi:ribonuclease HII